MKLIASSNKAKTYCLEELDAGITVVESGWEKSGGPNTKRYHLIYECPLDGDYSYEHYFGTKEWLFHEMEDSGWITRVLIELFSKIFKDFEDFEEKEKESSA